MALALLGAIVGSLLVAFIWWRNWWANQASVPRRKPGAMGDPELRVTLGRRAYRWPFALAVGGPVIGLTICATMLLTDDLWESGVNVVRLILWGAGGSLVGLAGAAWALAMHRSRLIVTISEDGIALRRRDSEVTIPPSAVHAVGLTWPISDPVWTTWYDPAAAPGIAAITEVGPHPPKEQAATLLRDRSLPAGWLEAVHTATTEILGGVWRVLDDRGQEVPPPATLLDADHVLVDGQGRYRAAQGGVLLAQACGSLAKQSKEGASFFATNPNNRRRSIVLRDPHARTVLIINRSSRMWGREHVTVLDADGKRLGRLHGRGKISLKSAQGALVGTAREVDGGYVVTDGSGQEVASLRTKSKADNSRMWLDLSPQCPEPLRPVAFALPIAMRISRQV